MINSYFTVLIFVFLAFSIGLGFFSLCKILGRKNTDNSKFSPYECGFETFGDSRIPFDVRFYLVAILFIIFDVETAFLSPWAVGLRSMNFSGFSSGIISSIILTVGLLYAWKKGGLEWK